MADRVCPKQLTFKVGHCHFKTGHSGSKQANTPKGLVFEAGRLARSHNEDRMVWAAVAEEADRQLEIKSRHRTGNGVWFANFSVEHSIVNWDSTMAASWERAPGAFSMPSRSRRAQFQNTAASTTIHTCGAARRTPPAPLGTPLAFRRCLVGCGPMPPS